jgi:hypothetical protein
LRLTAPSPRRPTVLATGPLRVTYSLLDPLAAGIDQITEFKLELPNGDDLQGRFAELAGLLRMTTTGPQRLELRARKAELTASRLEGRLGADFLNGFVTFRPDPSGSGQAALVEIGLGGVSRPGFILLGQELSGANVDVKLDIQRADLLRRGPYPFALDTWRRSQGEVEIVAAAASLGELNLTLAGRLSLDEERRLEGTISGRARGGEAAARLVRERFTGLAAQLAGAARRLDLPYRLTLRGGKIKLGPVTLGELRPLF